jgi:hypothetical protein
VLLSLRLARLGHHLITGGDQKGAEESKSGADALGQEEGQEDHVTATTSTTAWDHWRLASGLILF